MMTSFSLHATCSLSFYELCMLSFHYGHLAVGQRACRLSLPLTLNRFLWIAQWDLHGARVKATNHAGVGNYKSNPPQLRVETINDVYEDQILV